MLIKSKRWLWHVLPAIAITSLIGFFIPKALFISGFIIALDLFKLSYSGADDKDFRSDLHYLLLMVVICGISIFLLWVVCNFVPNNQSCSVNSFRAMMFAIISFPVFMGAFIWATTRLPKIFGTNFKK